jgi:hypothetical protein
METTTLAVARNDDPKSSPGAGSGNPLRLEPSPFAPQRFTHPAPHPIAPEIQSTQQPPPRPSSAELREREIAIERLTNRVKAAKVRTFRPLPPTCSLSRTGLRHVVET